MEFSFFMARLTFSLRNCSCLDNLTIYLLYIQIGHAELTEKWVLNFPKQGDTVLHGFCFMKKCARYSVVNKRKQLTNFAKIGMTFFQISCFIKKSARYCEFVGWRSMHQCNRRIYFGSQMSLSFLEFWKLFTVHLLFTYVVLGWSWMELKTR